MYEVALLVSVLEQRVGCEVRIPGLREGRLGGPPRSRTTVRNKILQRPTQPIYIERNGTLRFRRLGFLRKGKSPSDCALFSKMLPFNPKD